MGNYKIENIKEFRWEFCDIPYLENIEFSTDNFSSDINFDATVFDELEIIQIFFHARYSLKKKKVKKPIQVIHSDIDIDFRFDDFKADYKDQDQEYRKMLLIQLLGITISTARGIIFSNTKGNQVNKLILPIINPMDLFEAKQSREENFWENKD